MLYEEKEEEEEEEEEEEREYEEKIKKEKGKTWRMTKGKKRNLRRDIEGEENYVVE